MHTDRGSCGVIWISYGAVGECVDGQGCQSSPLSPLLQSFRQSNPLSPFLQSFRESSPLSLLLQAQYIAACCSVMQCATVCVIVCCSVLQCVPLCSSRWCACQHAQHFIALQYIAACCSVLQCAAVCFALCYSNWCACQHAHFATIIYCHITIHNSKFPVWVPIISLPH